MNARGELRDKSTDLSIHLSELSQYHQYPRIEGGGSASDSTGTEKVCVSVAYISFHSSQVLSSLFFRLVLLAKD